MWVVGLAGKISQNSKEKVFLRKKRNICIGIILLLLALLFIGVLIYILVSGGGVLFTSFVVVSSLFTCTDDEEVIVEDAQGVNNLNSPLPPGGE